MKFDDIFLVPTPVEGGRRVVKRREASVWLRDRSVSPEDVEEKLNNLLDRGVGRPSKQQVQ